MTPTLLSALIAFSREFWLLEPAHNERVTRKIIVDGRITYAQDNGKTISFKELSNHQKIAKKAAEETLMKAWKAWKQGLSKRVPALTTARSNPAVIIEIDIYDATLVHLLDAHVSFGDIKMNWRRHPEGIRATGMPSNSSKAVGATIDTIFDNLSTLPKATGIYGFGQITPPSGYTNNSSFQTFCGASPAHAAIAMAYLKNPMRTLSMTKETAMEYLTQDVVQVLTSVDKNSLKDL